MTTTKPVYVTYDDLAGETIYNDSYINQISGESSSCSGASTDYLQMLPNPTQATGLPSSQFQTSRLVWNLNFSHSNY